MSSKVDGERVSDLLGAAKRALAQQDIATPALDARLLLQAVSGLAHEAMIADPQRLLPAAAAERFNGYVARRLKGEPVSRILGDREFYGRVFEVTAATLDPRPDTETLIEAALSFMPRDRACRLIDLGTGTGAIAITLLAERRLARAMMTDISPEALAVARRNAESHAVLGRSSFSAGSWFSGIDGRFDLILSNPPYIPAAILPTLAPEVRYFDPRLALDGGPDGLDPYREIAVRAPSFLAPEGRVIVEIGEGQAFDIEAIFEGHGLLAEARWKDLAGHVRCLGFKQA